MTSSNGIERALQQIIRRGWLLASLSRSYFQSRQPWLAELYPGHLGGLLHRGTPAKSGQWSVLVNGMTTVIADGETAEEALRNAITTLDNSDIKEVYERFERALEEWLDAIQTSGNRG